MWKQQKDCAHYVGNDSLRENWIRKHCLFLIYSKTSPEETGQAGMIFWSAPSDQDLLNNLKAPSSHHFVHPLSTQFSGVSVFPTRRPDVDLEQIWDYKIPVGFQISMVILLTASKQVNEFVFKEAYFTALNKHNIIFLKSSRMKKNQSFFFLKIQI